MKTTVASAAGELAELFEEARTRGHLVIVRTAPPQVDPRTPLLMALNQLFALTPTEGRMLLKLLQHQHVSREALHAAMSPDGIPTTGPRNVDVTVCKLRRKLADFDIRIVTIRGCGHGLADGARERIRELLADAGLDPTPRAKPNPAAGQHAE